MKCAKVDGHFEEKMQKLEELMRDLGIKISSSDGSGLNVDIDGVRFTVDNPDLPGSFGDLPRSFDEERLVLVDAD